MSREEILIVDDERNIRSSLEGILKDEGYRVRGVATGRGVVKAGRPGGSRPGCPGCLATGHGRASGVGGSETPPSGAARDYDLRSLYGGDGSQGDEARRLRFRRKAIEPRENCPRGAQCPGPLSVGAGEPGTSPDLGGAVRHRGREPRHPGAAGCRSSPPRPATAGS